MLPNLSGIILCSVDAEGGGEAWFVNDKVILVDYKGIFGKFSATT